MNRILFLSFSAMIISNQAYAQSAVVVRETVEFLLKKFGKEAAEFGAENLTKKTTQLASKYGDDAIVAMKKVGPSLFRHLEGVGEKSGKQIVKIMAKYGDESMHIISRPGRLTIFLRYGDDAASAMLKHGEICDPLIKKFGAPAAKALVQVSDQNARRIVMMANEGELLTTSKAPELLETIGKYGNKAVEFVWKNKATLAVGSTLAVFLADPQPFIDGVKELASVPINNVSKLPNDLVNEGAKEAAKKTNFTLLGIISIFSITGIIAWRMFLKKQAEVTYPPSTN